MKATENIASASSEIRELYKHALLSREHSYSPYSGYKVGAAIRTSSGKIIAGCNVENASYGGAICAERSAVTRAISEFGKIKIVEVLVVLDSKTPWPPCGLCRQFICEFATPKTLVYMTNLAGIVETMKFSDLFPMGFSPEFLVPTPKEED